MSGKRKKYAPEFREQATRLVIQTGRPIAHVAAEIGVGEQLLGRWVRQARDDGSDNGAALDVDSVPSWSGCARRTPNCVWIGSFQKWPRPSSPANRTRRRLRSDRSGEGHLPDHQDV